MRLVSEPSTIHYLARMSRPFNIKKSIQYPQKQLPCQIPGGSVQYILSKALTQTDLKLRGCSHVSAPDRMLFIIGPTYEAEPCSEYLLLSNISKSAEAILISFLKFCAVLAPKSQQNHRTTCDDQELDRNIDLRSC